MNPAILEEAVQQFIDAHLKDDVHKLAMSTIPFSHVSAQEMAAQILAKRRSEKKLPTWFNTSGIYYPPTLSIEQCSSEKTAAYKSSLLIGEKVLDLTGGFGVDCVYFSKHAATVTHCELIPELSKIAAYNSRQLQIENIQFLNTDGIDYLSSTSDTFDTIYIDPARRGKSGKVFMLKDCSPNVVEHLDLLLSKASRVIIKTSPLLDISAGIKELRNVTEVQIISVKNECKELLFILDPEATKRPPTITSVTINEQIKQVTFGNAPDTSSSQEFTEEPTAAPGTEGAISGVSTKPDTNLNTYLYEPDVAILKSGSFQALGRMFNLVKLDSQSHLYTSSKINPDFPGRIFHLNEVLTKKELKKEKHLRGNVIVRNYPAKPDDLIKAFKIKPSQNEFLIFTKIHKLSYVILKASILQHY